VGIEDGRYAGGDSTGAHNALALISGSENLQNTGAHSA
jgi:hypothetical protein